MRLCVCTGRNTSDWMLVTVVSNEDSHRGSHVCICSNCGPRSLCMQEEKRADYLCGGSVSETALCTEGSQIKVTQMGERGGGFTLKGHSTSIDLVRLQKSGHLCSSVLYLMKKKKGSNQINLNHLKNESHVCVLYEIRNIIH